MKKILGALVLGFALLLTGCGHEQIPPGYVGKIVGTKGVLPEVYQTGRQWVGWNERMIYIDVSSKLRPAPVDVIMADYGLNSETGKMEQRIGLKMDFIVNVRYRLKDSEKTINAMLKDMTLGANTSTIDVQEVYNKYGNMVIGRVSREILGEYTPEEVLTNLKEINKKLFNTIKDSLENSPLEISSVSLGPVTLPKVITDRIDKNKAVELSEAEKRADQKISMLAKQNELQLAEQQDKIDEVNARSLAKQNRILNNSLTEGVIRLRELQIREKEIDMMGEALKTGNNNTVFVPYGAVDSAGAQFRMFNK